MYTIRILSATTDAPSARDIADAATRAGHAPAGIRGADLDDAGWRAIDLEYEGDRCPLRLERTLVEEPGALPEVARFLARIGKPGRSRAKQQVRATLEETRQILAFGIPDHVIDEENWGIVHTLLRFLHTWVGGLIQADGEGFYDLDGKLLVPLEME